jgi:hypothetical protein
VTGLLAVADEGAEAMLELIRQAYAAGQELAAAQAAYKEEYQAMLARAADRDKEVNEAEHIYEAAQAVLERLIREAYAAGRVLPQLRAAVRTEHQS